MIDWLIQQRSDLPAVAPELWLSVPERDRMRTLRMEKRREEWLLGRWTARRLIQAWTQRELGFAPHPTELMILPAPDGAPEIHALDPALRMALGTVRLTISHSAGQAFCALAPAGAPVGADIEQIEPRHANFAETYYTPGELALLEATDPSHYNLLLNAIWSTKEAVLKALRHGLRVDTRLVECLVPLLDAADQDAGWRAFLAHCDPSLGAPPAGVRCWWRQDHHVVLTIAAITPRLVTEQVGNRPVIQSPLYGI
ncbi:4'-phosphopantetheinyl transferase superfamily protein [Candidatus Chloroploca sp. Khr17]|uniref:4'-phosphopantetheinyl transferase family protein n=1 Tax=Candidatus Chloroploca sp. Khr17 TaxID=2496869 RepID=UPI00101CA1C7|nr:4'-phosphopantetheinyl transferase superfamily protein [Candidatus Chloroploca sp. Khr17]